MENRFGIRDFFLFALIFIVIAMIVLSMTQVDRQWKSIQALQEQSRQQGRDLIEIRRTLAEGVAVSAPTAPTTQGASATAPASNLQQLDPNKPTADEEKLPGFARGDWWVDNCDGKLKAMTPFIGQDVYAYWIQALVHQTLLYYDVDSVEKVPLLAKGWEVSPDGKVITFHLRHGITFSDGEPFTADDVVFTFDWIRNPNVNAPRERGTMELLQDVKKLDDFTVQFTFKEFFFKALAVVGQTPILAKHFISKYTPEQFNETPGLMMGTGPYRMSDPAGWKPGDRIMLLRNDRYWGKPPAPNRIIFYEVQEEVALQTMFTNGELDMMVATAEQFVKMKQDPKVLAMANPLEYVYMLSGYGYVSWNEEIDKKPTVFASKAVRQAMTMLIDRERICKEIFLGYASVAHGTFAPGSKQNDPNLKPWPYDPERAKKLLESAGIYDRDGDGVLDTPDGKPFRFKLTFPNKYAVYDRMTLLIKDSFAKVGIIMERDPVEWPILQQKLLRHEFDSCMLGWGGEVEEDPHQLFHSNQIADQGDNTMSYRSEECDKAIDEARVCVDDAKRNELWQKVDRILAEDCPYTFLANRRSTVFINKRWQNVRNSTMGLNWNRLDCDPMPWFVPQAQQRYTQ